MRPLIIEIKRTYKNNCTCGELCVNDDSTGETILKGIKTLELPNLNNQNYISCIEEGFYIVKPYSSRKFKDALKIYSVAESKETCQELWENLEARVKWLEERKDSNKNLIEAKGRSAILIHQGNSVNDFMEGKDGYHWRQESKGCILVGTRAKSVLSGKREKYQLVLNSQGAMKQLLKVVKDEGIACLFIYGQRQGFSYIMKKCFY